MITIRPLAITSICLTLALCNCRSESNAPPAEPATTQSTDVAPAPTADPAPQSSTSPAASPGAAVEDEAPPTKSASDASSSLSEDDKIEALIAALAELKDATFIRNGESHDVAEAIEHMRRKWNWKAAEIKTAEDFIRIAATGSSMSGKPYVIRFADGRETPSGEWFRKKLADITQAD